MLPRSNYLLLSATAVLAAAASACGNGVGYPILAEDPAAGGVGVGGDGGDGDVLPEGGGAGDLVGPTCVPVAQGPLRDADKDDIIDALDPDDDNDGASDLDECFSGGARFINPSFEEPVAPDVLYYADESAVPGWSTDSATNEIEYWQGGFNGVPSADGGQFIEVARAGTDTISQTIATIPGTTLRWALHHRGRVDSETLELSIGAPAELEVQEEMSTGVEWIIYEGTYEVPAGQTATMFAYRAVSPTDGSGNLLDLLDAEPICLTDTDDDGCVDTEDAE